MIVATMFFIYQSQDGNPFGDGLTFDMIYFSYAHKANIGNLFFAVFYRNDFLYCAVALMSF